VQRTGLRPGATGAAKFGKILAVGGDGRHAPPLTPSLASNERMLMIHVFVDETSDTKFKDYFGLCCAAVKHTFYRQIKTDFQRILIDGGWDPAVEFKGSYLFSASKGCPEVPVDRRVDLAEAVIDLNIARENARMKFTYLRSITRNQKATYLSGLPILLDRALPRVRKGQRTQGKDLITVHCDYRNDILLDEIRDAVLPILQAKGYTLFEDVAIVTSNFETVGIAYADIVGYLVARIDTIANDSDLFENIPPELFETNGKIRKLRSSAHLISKVKRLSVHPID